MIFSIAIIIGVIAIIFKLLTIGTTLSNPGKKLNLKIVSLNPIKGKTKDQIIAVAGMPNIVTAVGNGNNSYTWTQDWYSITLLFNDQNTCIGVTNQKLK